MQIRGTNLVEHNQQTHTISHGNCGVNPGVLVCGHMPRPIRLPALMLLVLALPILLLSSTLLWAASSARLYEYGFDKYNISQSTGIEPAELSRAATELTAYFNSPGQRLVEITVIRQGQPFQLFNAKEQGHLLDVKDLIRFGYRVRLASLLVILLIAAAFLWAERRRPRGVLLRAGMAGGLLTAGFMLVLGILALVGFDQLFLEFHLLSFSNLDWQLDPARDYLIRMFPQGFFNDAALFVFLAVLIEALALAAICRALLKGSTSKSKNV